MNLARIVDGHPAEATALVADDLTITYGTLRDQIAGLRGGLHELGIGPGDRVAIVCANTPQFVVGYLAIVGIGAIAVPLNPASPALELERELRAVEPVAIVVDHRVLPEWGRVDRTAVPSLTHVAVTERVPDLPPATHLLEDLMAAAPVPVVDVDADTIAVMMFTSGTAGSPRAAMLSHGNLLSNIEQGCSAPVHTEASDVVYGVLPLFHIFGLNVTLGMTLAVGATLVLAQRFDPSAAAATIMSQRVTVLPGAPPMWVAFAASEDVDADTFASVRIALSGASRLPPVVALECEERFGLEIAEGYGLTEASPVVTSSAGMGERPRYGSVGRVLDGIEVRLVNAEGEAALVGDIGEILVRGANVFRGYHDDPAATARAIDDDGWLHTGDLATVDDDGWLYLVDRAKDLIIVSGFNVFPAEVEAVLCSHPAVAEAGVVGVPHPTTGEVVRAFVSLVPGAEVDVAALIEHAGERLARYKCPATIHVVDELPRNVSGKLLRRHLGELG